MRRTPFVSKPPARKTCFPAFRSWPTFSLNAGYLSFPSHFSGLKMSGMESGSCCCNGANIGWLARSAVVPMTCPDGAVFGRSVALGAVISGPAVAGATEVVLSRVAGCGEVVLKRNMAPPRRAKSRRANPTEKNDFFCRAALAGLGWVSGSIVSSGWFPRRCI